MDLVFADPDGMRVELRHAEARGIPIRFAVGGDEP